MQLKQHLFSWSDIYIYIIGWTLKTLHALLTNLWGVFMCFYVNSHAMLT